jgi:hypothetical protein
MHNTLRCLHAEKTCTHIQALVRKMIVHDVHITLSEFN